MAKFLKRLCRNRILLCGMAVCMLTALMGAEASAADPYTYTVTIYAGNQGTMVSADDLTVTGDSGNSKINVTGDKIVISGLAYGARVGFDAQAGKSVQLRNTAEGTVSEGDPTGSKYIIMGIRESGRDNKGAGNANFVVTEDRDYVVAYGIKGNLVAYTVRYEDAQGRELEKPRTYYGNIGDTPVVGYIYIDGYRPQAYNLTKELVANEEENVFTFVYTPMETGGGGGGGGGGANETITVIVPGENPGGQTGTTIIQEGAGGAGGAAGAAGGAADGGAGAGEEAGAPAAEEPAELINLDDEEVPLADAPVGDEEVPLAGAAQGTFPIIAGVLIAILAVVLIVIAVIMAKKRKEKENEEDSAEDKS